MLAQNQQSPQFLLFLRLKTYTILIPAPVSSPCMCICTCPSVCSLLNVCRYMCRRVQVCVCVDVCRPSSVNIVLCSSNSSSLGSAVAAHSTVYFPSWRTTSYQISRHCLWACCPTTRSQRTSRPLSSRLSSVKPSLVHDDWQPNEPLTSASVPITASTQRSL